MEHQHINDNALLSQIAEGDRAAFTILYERYASNLFRFADSFCSSREVSEEIVQEIFLKVWLNRDTLTRITSVKSYLYQTAKNVSLNYIKRARIEDRVLNVVEYNNKNTVSLLENELVYNEYSELAKVAIDMLPVKRKEIFKLRLNEDLSLDEISEKLHISKSVVKKQLYSGMNFVRGYLSRHGAFINLIALLLFYKN